MNELRWVDRKEMNRPILIVALKGLFDAAEAATAGVDLLIAKYSASLVAEIDPESFFNFQVLLKRLGVLLGPFGALLGAPEGSQKRPKIKKSA